MGCAASVPDEDKQHRKGKGKGKGKEIEPTPPVSTPTAETATTTTTPTTVPITEQPKHTDTTPPKPAEQPQTEQPKPAEQPPAEPKPTEQSHADPKPADQPLPDQSKPAEQPIPDAPPANQTKPAELDNKPDPSVSTVSTETKPEEHKSEELKSAETTTTQTESTPTRQAKIAVVYYSMYGHILQLAEVVAEGIRNAGAIADIYQVHETLSEEILQKMHAPPKAAYPVIETATLKDYDGMIFGIPTRYGIWPTQWKTFLDSTGQLWQSGGLHGKMGAVFTSTASQHGGIETTAFTAITFFAHHGISFVPMGYARSFPELTSLSEVVGGTPYGAGTMAGGDGSRQPTDTEKRVCLVQGETFAETVKRQFC